MVKILWYWLKYNENCPKYKNDWRFGRQKTLKNIDNFRKISWTVTKIVQNIVKFFKNIVKVFMKIVQNIVKMMKFL